MNEKITKKVKQKKLNKKTHNIKGIKKINYRHL